MDSPYGWIDLDPVFVESFPEILVVDCLVTRICLDHGRSGRRGSLVVGEPITFGVHQRRPDHPTESSSHYPDHGPLPLDDLEHVGAVVEEWIDDGAEVSLLRDDQGDVLLLSRGDELLALELEPG